MDKIPFIVFVFKINNKCVFQISDQVRVFMYYQAIFFT